MSRLYIDQSSRVYVDQSNRLFVDNPVPVISPLYSLWVDSLTANETTDNTITFYLSAQNINVIDLPMTVPFQVIGAVDENDFLVGTQLSGTFVLSDNNTIASQTFEVLADSTTEGDETMTLVLTSVAGIACPLEAQSLSGSVLIYDTSLFPPGYTLSINPTQANETTSNVFDIKLTTTGVANGTIIPFRMTGVGISAVDFTGVAALTGFFEVTEATVPPDLTPVVTTQTYTITADKITEGTEVLTVTLSSAGGISCPIEAEGLSKQISISDTSLESSGIVTLLLNANGSDGANNNTFLDSSSNSFNITRTGSVTQGSFSPFPLNGAVYDPAIDGGGGYFDGSSYLTVPNTTQFDFGSGSLTIEFWGYLPDTNSRIEVFSNEVSGFRSIICYFLNKKLNFKAYKTNTNAGPDTIDLESSISYIPNTWTHFAVVRNSTDFALYVNGVLADSGSSSNIIQYSSTSLLRVGYRHTETYYQGYMSDFRIAKGTALYTSNFSIPTAPLTNVANTSLLLNFANGKVIDDSAIKNMLITTGNVQITTAVKKYGSGSLSFDGTNDWIQIPGGSHFAYGTGNFTIEFWCNFTRVTVPSGTLNPRIISQGTNSSTRLQIYIEDTATSGRGPIGGLVLYTTSIIGNTNVAVNDGNWHHIAFARQAGTIRTFVDGVLKDTRANSTNFSDITTGYTIGAYNNSTSGDYLGYIDDLRITKGAALYTSNFTPPTEELTINV